MRGGNVADHPIDYVKDALVVAGVILGLVGMYRWYTVNEGFPKEEESCRRFGYSILDARTDQDPLVGMRPVRTPDRRG